MDFREQFIKRALEETVGPYRPEKSLRSRALRIGLVALLAIAAFLAMAAILDFSMPRPDPQARKHKPVAVDILPPAGKGSAGK